jgi:hypothetical protein
LAWLGQLCGALSLQDDETAAVAAEGGLPADALYRLCQHSEERVRTLTYATLPQRFLSLTHCLCMYRFE